MLFRSTIAFLWNYLPLESKGRVNPQENSENSTTPYLLNKGLNLSTCAHLR